MEKLFFEYDLFITSVTAAVHVPAGAGERVHRDRPAHGVAYHTGGVRVYRFKDGTVLTARAGDLVYLPRGSDYDMETQEPGDCYAINFLLSGNVPSPPTVTEVRRREQMELLFRDAAYRRRARETAYREHCMADLYRVICLWKEQTAAPYASCRSRQILRKAQAYIAAHYTEPTPVGAVASSCGVSEVYLRRLFREGLGQSPVEYIRDLRLSYARELLSLKEYTVSEVCDECGFGDVSYFIRCYGKKYGTSPKKTDAAP